MSDGDSGLFCDVMRRDVVASIMACKPNPTQRGPVSPKTVSPVTVSPITVSPNVGQITPMEIDD
jgi:hypothetical protein